MPAEAPMEAVAAPAFLDLLERAREIVRTRLLPLEPAMLAGPFRDLAPQLAAVRDEVRAAGMWTPHLPAAMGGMGLALGEFARLSEELGRSPLGHFAFNCAAPDIGNMELLHRHGSPEQHEQFLKPLAAGATRSCFGMT